MNIGSQISKLRSENHLTQEAFGELFFVTRQTVSNWENEKSYPDLQMLIDISNRFGISLDELIKDTPKMVTAIDNERKIASLKKKNSTIDAFLGAGIGLFASTLISPDSTRKTIVIVVAFLFFAVSLYQKSKNDKKIFEFMDQVRRMGI